MASVATAPAEPGGRVLIKRHSLLVRITHWINALAIFFLVLSGLQIFNAHPALYIGQKSDFQNPVLSMSAFRLTDGRAVGETKILGAKFDTTGVLGLSYVDGQPQARGFPAWATVPSYQDLATGRRWHFFFAWLFAINGAIYLAAGFANRHVWRDLIPSGAQLRGIGRSILDHLRLRFDHGRDYNVLQKVTYLIVIFVLLPLIVLTGMTMSPGLNAALPWLVDVFGGRQTARTIHFICAAGIVLFIVVHLVMVLISGVWNNLRSMITGRYAVTPTGATPMVDPNRRRLLAGIATTLSAAALASCDNLSQAPWFRRVLHTGEDFNRTVQGFFLKPTTLAREFAESDISPAFRANGSTDPADPDYKALAANGFADWKLKVGGLVEKPMEFSLADLRAMPSRTQITRHDCVEGWSCIGKWTGVPLAHVLEQVKVKPETRFIMFTCFDELEQTLDGSGRYYETLGLEDAYHPQTILAHGMNGQPLTVPHGAPLRVRVERQLGYKMAKYVMQIDAIDSFESRGRGNGGFWEDRGYDWYAGI